MAIAVLISGTAVAILSVLSILLFLRAIVSWFPMEGSVIEQFLYATTEPVVSPVRNVLSRNELFASTPLDMSVLFTMLIVYLVMFLVSGF